MVHLGGGLISGKVMLAGWKNMKPQEQYFSKYLQLYEHIEDKNYIEKTEKFESWYENVYDLPGTYYLETIKKIFKENRLVKGEFIAQGELISLHNINCPVYLLAGSNDEITPVEQVFDAEKYLGTPPKQVIKKLVDSGHLGLFMGAKPLLEAWPQIARWISASGKP
jgi:poly(3-hydroxyalkanoate) synthetase